ncbi:hypothetical protein DUG79_25620 [Vibrio parahaemolyticus]|nr:hypothetical protein [Vibrio parahaemolyticus]
MAARKAAAKKVEKPEEQPAPENQEPTQPDPVPVESESSKEPEEVPQDPEEEPAEPEPESQREPKDDNLATCVLNTGLATAIHTYKPGDRYTATPETIQRLIDRGMAKPLEA